MLDKFNDILSNISMKNLIQKGKFCNFCNKLISPNAINCPHCGEPQVTKEK